ncbi:PIN domain-containing protein [Stenomitos frigidus]|uniref:VapC toxin family PIN domain ribonuclease n=1 Tax=Stenomitos frigidus ULC18 TaxID=2107698 RepID=A0A2T1ELU3_9CYAN|nr:PIN domain-containing protein [Stenomitos frigidus]PSB33681.1 VapC toxin family PIN domain ribonuclease [Stenomitos frigidus ULC18]
MTYLLDTNTCIRLLNDDRNAPVPRRLARLQPEAIRLCSVVKAELYDGAYRSSMREQNLATLGRLFNQFSSLPLDDQAALLAGHIRFQLTASGTSIGPHDVLIAAISLANNLTLVTHNTQEFARVAGLSLEGWE